MTILYWTLGVLLGFVVLALIGVVFAGYYVYKNMNDFELDDDDYEYIY